MGSPAVKEEKSEQNLQNTIHVVTKVYNIETPRVETFLKGANKTLLPCFVEISITPPPPPCIV